MDTTHEDNIAANAAAKPAEVMAAPLYYDASSGIGAADECYEVRAHSHKLKGWPRQIIARFYFGVDADTKQQARILAEELAAKINAK